MPTAHPTAIAPPPTRRQLFTGFFQLGVIGFGGVLPLMRSMLVERRRWLDEDEFADLLGLCQFLPGGNGLNLAVAVGMKFRGPSGALCALLGLITVPTAIVVLLGLIYDRYRNDPDVHRLFAGLAAAAAGMLVSMAIKLALPLRRRPLALALAALGLLAIAVLRLPLVAVMLALLPLSVFVLERFER